MENAQVKQGKQNTRQGIKQVKVIFIFYIKPALTNPLKEVNKVFKQNGCQSGEYSGDATCQKQKFFIADVFSPLLDKLVKHHVDIDAEGFEHKSKITLQVAIFQYAHRYF